MAKLILRKVFFIIFIVDYIGCAWQYNNNNILPVAGSNQDPFEHLATNATNGTKQNSSPEIHSLLTPQSSLILKNIKSPEVIYEKTPPKLTLSPASPLQPIQQPVVQPLPLLQPTTTILDSNGTALPTPQNRPLKLQIPIPDIKKKYEEMKNYLYNLANHPIGPIEIPIPDIRIPEISIYPVFNQSMGLFQSLYYNIPPVSSVINKSYNLANYYMPRNLAQYFVKANSTMIKI